MRNLAFAPHQGHRVRQLAAVDVALLDDAIHRFETSGRKANGLGFNHETLLRMMPIPHFYHAPPATATHSPLPAHFGKGEGPGVREGSCANLRSRRQSPSVVRARSRPNQRHGLPSPPTPLPSIMDGREKGAAGRVDTAP